jgi:hypothetical protein
VWSTSTKNNGIALPKVHGSGSVTVSLSDLPLLEGTYLLSVALRNSNELNEFDHWEHGFKFDVLQQGRFDQGLVAINASWASRS